MLFDSLHDDAFRPFCGKYRHAYVAVLRRLADGLFSLDAPDQPLRSAVLSDVTECLQSWGAAHADDASGFRLEAADAYAELVAAGWLVEQRDGWAIYVEMEERAWRLLTVLCGLRDPNAARYGGAMIAIASSLVAARADPRGSAQAVPHAAREAKAFARYVRGIIGTLKGIERVLLEQASLNGLVRTFFDEYVGRIVGGDYRTLTISASHPCGFKWRILDAVEAIGDDSALASEIAAGLMEQGEASSKGDALALVDRSLADIRSSLAAIEGFRTRIDAAKAEVERRFSNSLRYMDMIDSGRAAVFVSSLEAIVPGDWDEVIDVPLGLLREFEHWDLGRAAPYAMPRRPVEVARFRQVRPDPLRLAFDRAKSEFDRRLAITPQRFMEYVGDKMQGRDSVRGEELSPCDVEEMVVLSALLASPVCRVGLPGGYVLKRVPGGRIVTPTLEFDDFVIELAAAHADEEGRHAG
jgi:hypothetical protein